MGPRSNLISSEESDVSPKGPQTTRDGVDKARDEVDKTRDGVDKNWPNPAKTAPKPEKPPKNGPKTGKTAGNNSRTHFLVMDILRATSDASISLLMIHPVVRMASPNKASAAWGLGRR